MQVTFQRAPAAGFESWMLDDGVLSTGGKRIDLRLVTKVSFVMVPAGRQLFVHMLTLDAPSGRVQVQCNASFSSAHRRAALQLMAAVCERLAELAPGIQVQMGGGGWHRWAYFALGAGLSAFAIRMLVKVATSSGSRPIAMFVLFGVFLGLGLWIAAPNLPWRKAPRVDAVEAGRRLAAMAGG